MAKLLSISASPRKERSLSLTAAHAFLDGYQTTHPSDSVEILDLWTTPLPPFNDDTLNAKYAILHGQPHSPEQAAAWEVVSQMARQFTLADCHLLSVPMWNFSIPYRLKHYIDLVTQPGLTFTFSPEAGYSGLVIGRPIQVIYTRGGEYPAGSPAAAVDFQKSYLEHWLRFVGFSDIRSLVIEPTLAPARAAQTRQDALTQARLAGEAFP